MGDDEVGVAGDESDNRSHSLGSVQTFFTARLEPVEPDEKHRGVIVGLGLGSLVGFGLLGWAPESSAAEVATIAEVASDSRGTLLLFVVAPAILWVLYNILQPTLNQINKMRSDSSRGESLNRKAWSNGENQRGGPPAGLIIFSASSKYAFHPFLSSSTALSTLIPSAFLAADQLAANRQFLFGIRLDPNLPADDVAWHRSNAKAGGSAMLRSFQIREKRMKQEWEYS
ncbi:hypothetical protein K1719_034012 [Acacia pycnantha]|nr:hypothetical protein K1719_034012 [Acacia pycnantha]